MKNVDKLESAKKRHLNRNANGINYRFEFEPDGWVSIYELNDSGLPIPVIQACNLEKAEEYIYFRERPNVPIVRLF